MCFTDCVTEEINVNNEEFSTQYIEKIILSNKSEAIVNIIDHIIYELNEFKARNEFSDDVALLGLRFK